MKQQCYCSVLRASPLCRMCVKSLVDKSSFEVISEECSHLHNLCTVMDNIIRHRLLRECTRLSWWGVVSRASPSLARETMDSRGGVMICVTHGSSCIVYHRYSYK